MYQGFINASGLFASSNSVLSTYRKHWKTDCCFLKEEVLQNPVGTKMQQDKCFAMIL